MYVGPVILVNQRTTRIKKCVAHLIKDMLAVVFSLRVGQHQHEASHDSPTHTISFFCLINDNIMQ